MDKPDEALALRSAECLTVPLGYPTYRAILDPLWTPILRGILETRAYEDGLNLAFRLLEAFARYRVLLTPRQQERHQIRLYQLVLTMLDRADRWAEYLEVWESLRQAPLMLEYSGGRRVHFLSLQAHRRELIARKLGRAQAGDRTGNLRHAPQDRLSAEEIRRRLAWIREMARMRTLEGKAGSK